MNSTKKKIKIKSIGRLFNPKKLKKKIDYIVHLNMKPICTLLPNFGKVINHLDFSLPTFSWEAIAELIVL